MFPKKNHESKNNYCQHISHTAFISEIQPIQAQNRNVCQPAKIIQGRIRTALRL